MVLDDRIMTSGMLAQVCPERAVARAQESALNPILRRTST